MIGILPQPVPADPDIAEFNVTLSGNGNDKTDYVATTYKVRVWDEKNVMSQFFELSGHRVGEALLTIESTDGSGVKKEFTVNIVEPEREPAIDYNEGTIMLNEEWFGHTNGGLNWYSPDYDVVYQAYERENPGMSFGCTSQYGIVYEGKLFVSSKQATDNGDPLPGGGRLVVADASTLKRLGSIDNIMIEGRGQERRRSYSLRRRSRPHLHGHPLRASTSWTPNDCAGHRQNRRIIRRRRRRQAQHHPSGSLYNGQVGDMLLAKDKVCLATCQSKGLLHHRHRDRRGLSKRLHRGYGRAGRITQSCRRHRVVRDQHSTRADAATSFQSTPTHSRKVDARGSSRRSRHRHLRLGRMAHRPVHRRTARSTRFSSPPAPTSPTAEAEYITATTSTAGNSSSSAPLPISRPTPPPSSRAPTVRFVTTTATAACSSAPPSSRLRATTAGTGLML